MSGARRRAIAASTFPIPSQNTCASHVSASVTRPLERSSDWLIERSTGRVTSWAELPAPSCTWPLLAPAPPGTAPSSSPPASFAHRLIHASLARSSSSSSALRPSRHASRMELAMRRRKCGISLCENVNLRFSERKSAHMTEKTPPSVLSSWHGVSRDVDTSLKCAGSHPPCKFVGFFFAISSISQRRRTCPRPAPRPPMAIR